MEHAVLMILYSLHKRQYLVLILICCALFSLCLLLNSYGPNKYETYTKTENVTKLQPSPTFNTTTDHISVYNQHICVSIQFTTAVSDGGFDKEFESLINVYGLIDSSDSRPATLALRHKSKATLKCPQKKCDPIPLFHISTPLDYDRYSASVTLNHLANLPYTLNTLSFVILMINADYTNFEICFKFIFLLISFISTVVFSKSMRKFQVRDWSIEQRCISFILPLLMIFNNPLYPLCYLGSNSVKTAASILDALFERTFVAGLLLFWLVIYDGVRKKKHDFRYFLLPKMSAIVAPYTLMLALAISESFVEFQGGSNVSFEIYKPAALVICLQASMATYAAYLLYLIFRSYQQVSSLAYFDLRLKVFTTCLVILLFVLSILEFYHKHDKLTSEMADHATASLLKRGSYFLYATSLNIYVIFLAYVYSPAPNASFDSQFKDNPTFSMLNNSDDELQYGSEDEHFNINTL